VNNKIPINEVRAGKPRKDGPAPLGKRGSEFDVEVINRVKLIVILHKSELTNMVQIKAPTARPRDKEARIEHCDVL